MSSSSAIYYYITFLLTSWLHGYTYAASTLALTTA